MKTIKQIGNAALVRLFKPKNAIDVAKGITYTRKVCFPEVNVTDMMMFMEINPLEINTEGCKSKYSHMVAVWGIELGLHYIKCNTGYSIGRTLMMDEKLKKERISPSHLIIMKCCLDDFEDNLFQFQTTEEVEIYHIPQSMQEYISKSY